MQEVLVIQRGAYPIILPAGRSIVSGIKWIIIGVWKPIRWLLEAMFVPHPIQRRIEENRVRAIRMLGHF